VREGLALRRDLTLDDLEDFLALPVVAVLATRRRDDGLLLSPVWHQYRDGGFDVTTAIDDIKARHLRRDARATLLVYEQQLPYRGVELQTEAQLSTDGADAIAQRIALRYLGTEYPVGEQVLIRLEPGNVRAWDFADEF
jgi:PPOX class probable F420-dependent enzyme